MSNDVVVIAEHSGGKLSDATFELVGKATELAAAAEGEAVVLLVGAPELADHLGVAQKVVTIDDPNLNHYTAEGYERALSHSIATLAPRLVLVATSTQGLDLAAALSALCTGALVSYVVGIEMEGDTVLATSQIYGGKIMAEVAIESAPAFCAVSAGSFPADAGRGVGTPTIEAAGAADLGDLRTAFRAMNKPDAGDVDITAADVLVAVGRGIGGADDVELVQEFADAIGAPLAASRPVTDAGWLPKSRQVGKSGFKVKPRAYIMFGISGAPEHLEGMRDADLIIACNTDEKAPIFDVAHYGTTADLFDVLPALADLVE